MKWIFLLIALTSADASAALLDHFKGRYGAIEVLDSGKKLSFRVNPPELSQKRNFCEFDRLALAITAVDKGLVKDFLTPIAVNAKESITLKQALRSENSELFSQFEAKLNTDLQSMRAKKLLPSGRGFSAFEILEWFKALQENRVALKSATIKSLSQVLVQRNRNQTKLWAFSSRCDESLSASGKPQAVGASIGFLQRKGLAPIYFAVSVDGKNRKELFNVAIAIRDGALKELKYIDEAELRNRRAAPSN